MRTSDCRGGDLCFKQVASICSDSWVKRPPLFLCLILWSKPRPFSPSVQMLRHAFFVSREYCPAQEIALFSYQLKLSSIRLLLAKSCRYIANKFFSLLANSPIQNNHGSWRLWADLNNRLIKGVDDTVTGKPDTDVGSRNILRHTWVSPLTTRLTASGTRSQATLT